MVARIIDGKAIAERVQKSLRQRIRQLNRPPGLGIVRVCENPASKVYVTNKLKAAKALGINAVERHLAEDAAESAVCGEIESLCGDAGIDGILVQLPLPRHLSERRLLDEVPLDKDVDGFSLLNLGRLWAGEKCIISATPKGVLRLLSEEN